MWRRPKTLFIGGGFVFEARSARERLTTYFLFYFFFWCVREIAKRDLASFYILLTVHHLMILGKRPT